MYYLKYRTKLLWKAAFGKEGLFSLQFDWGVSLIKIYEILIYPLITLCR